MVAAINAGRDLHRVLAARVAGKPEEDVTAEERKRAKPIGFGKPGGMGHKALQSYARAGYGIELADAEVEALSESWFEAFPEMRTFLADEADLGGAVAALYGLTPAGHAEHTGSDRFLRHPENAARADRPHPILGGMLLKTLRDERPRTAAGREYSAEEVDYFWSRIEGQDGLLPARLHGQLRSRRPSRPLRLAVLREAGRADVFTLSGRLRARASYAARHNTIFQGLAADGAKLALWELWRAGYRIVNFIHDEVLVEVPAGEDVEGHRRRVESLMVEGMRAVVPHVAVRIESTVGERWTK
jgi:hypothetical protein